MERDQLFEGSWLKIGGSRLGQYRCCLCCYLHRVWQRKPC